jgi:hypothetical protein
MAKNSRITAAELQKLLEEYALQELEFGDEYDQWLLEGWLEYEDEQRIMLSQRRTGDWGV